MEWTDFMKAMVLSLDWISVQQSLVENIQNPKKIKVCCCQYFKGRNEKVSSNMGFEWMKTPAHYRFAVF